MLQSSSVTDIRKQCVNWSVAAQADTPATLQDKYDTPIVADIHFQPTVALMCAEAFEKVRVNPGNFADGRKTFEEIDYDDPSQFEEERAHIEEVFTPLVLKCKELGTAMRIGTNHGSLSARILSYYGDTPAGALICLFQCHNILNTLPEMASR